jgi:hypothetical protein
MRHPLEFLPQNLRKPIFLFFLALTILIFGAFRILDQPLRTSAALNGIVSFELAFTTDAAQSMLNSWDENARLFTAFGLGLDYLFMPTYAVALSLGLLLAGYGKSTWIQNVTSWLGRGALLAALFDAVENYALWNVIIGKGESLYPQLAGICASIKFFLLIIGLLGAVIMSFVGKRSNA